MTIHSSVSAALSALPLDAQNGWKAQTALTLASALDAEPNASMARELRAVMTDLESMTTVGEGDFLDELASRRESKPTG